VGRGCAILLGGMVAKVELARGMGLTARGAWWSAASVGFMEKGVRW
jgi:hypothetical protein